MDDPPRSSPRLAAALEAIAAAAALVDAHGRVIEANDAARALLASGTGVPRDLARHAALRGCTSDDDSGWSVTRVDSECDAAAEYLVIMRGSGEAALRDQVLAACDRWTLTRRQKEVLLLVVEGHTNQTIAEVLDISLRTVEVHVTALLDKAGAPSRSALASKVFTLRCKQ